MKTKWFGAHVSSAGGPQCAIARARNIGADAFALFIKNQRQWKAPPLEPTLALNFKQQLREEGFIPQQVLPHASYLINLGSPHEDLRERSFEALCEELSRARALGLRAVNLHPGSSLRQMSEESCLQQISTLISRALLKVPDVSVVLENTAGQGSNLGYRLEHLATIIAHLPSPLLPRIGVCLDTCHAFAAGYPLSTIEECEKFFETFDRLIGYNYLRGMHLNDSKTPLGSRVDRHACLGKGEIGWILFEYIARNARFNQLPLILETPDPDQWAQEITWLKDAEKGLKNKTKL